ncbi:anti-sigma factor family protein [Nocardioides sp. MAHUQ-72]|uniref:anti-sigma factor family protein n=1 Tax=unclassified Nocardioides TaxID=2615069 RepID=UPI0036061DE5
MSCEFSRLDGAYVLGALSTAERRAFEEHLAGCPSCSRAVQEIAGLPGLLARVGPGVLEEDPDEPPLPDTLLPRLLGEVRRVDRRRTALTAGLAAAAAVVVTVGAGFALGIPGDGGPDRGPSASAPTRVAAGRPMTPVGSDSGMQADVALAPVPWGTRLDLTCSYAVGPAAGYHDEPAGDATYALVVRTRDGRTEQVATWRSLPGRTMRLTAATSAAQAEIASVEVRTAQGEPVLRLTS